MIARLLAQHLTPELGQPVVVENRVGSNGMIGTDYVARSEPDGYTILLAPSGHAINNSLNPNVPYDPVKDFTFITLIGTVPMAVTANKAFPPNTIPELVAYAKANPGKLNFGSGGPGSSNQLATELFAHMAGIRMTHVPYRGDAPGIIDLVGGQISFIFLNTPAALPLIKNGKAKVLGITSPKRSPLLPDVPSIGETVPGYVAGSWHGIFGPAGMPKPVLDRLNAAFVKVINKPEVNEKLKGWGVNVVASSSTEFGAFVESEIKKWADVIKTADIKLQ
ncbi:MAG: tripartite tricarboxylate transporter substrate binding protein [Lautropia sp.]